MLNFDDFMNLTLICENNKLRNDVHRLTNEIRDFRNESVGTKDRVDISLKEYEELKRINKDLLDRLRHAEAILGNIGINADVIPLIVPETVRWYKSEYYPSPFEFKCKVMIEFLMED